MMRTKARVDTVAGVVEICRADVAGSSAPIRARMSDGREVFWIRANNSTRALPEVEQAAYIRDRWPEPADPRGSR